jgi:hypothetical protein
MTRSHRNRRQDHLEVVVGSEVTTWPEWTVTFTRGIPGAEPEPVGPWDYQGPERRVKDRRLNYTIAQDLRWIRSGTP